MLNILLITPGRRINGYPSIQSVIKAAVAPADLATIAGLTPADHHVEIWDEAIRGELRSPADLPRNYDIIGVGGYTADYERTVAIGKSLRGLSIPIVVGGVGVTSEPERYRDYFDVLFIGEAEYTWPRFLTDYASGSFLPEYRQVGRVSMEDSPPPRWERIAATIEYYIYGVVQTTRGCPFDCEFCDVITLFGRKPRHKPIAQVLDEVRTLERMGVAAIMLSDDNFYGDKTYSKPLLRELAALNRSFRRPLRFWTQITLNVSGDEEMLELLAEANVTSLLIGVESPNLDSLIETNKPQNYRLDIVAALKKIQGYGLKIEAQLIVGFDHDDAQIFDIQYKFIQEACLVPVSIWTLMAIPGTQLWVRLHKEKRVLNRPQIKRAKGPGMAFTRNVVPKLMSLEQLLRGYEALLRRVFAWPAFEERLGGLIASTTRYPPLMPRFRVLTPRRKLRLVLGILTNAAARRELRKRRNDLGAQNARKRLLASIAGDTPREKYLRWFVNNEIDAHWGLLEYTLPEVYAGIREELDHLARHGLPDLETTVFSMPDSFREPYKALFPAIHDRVRSALVDHTRTAVVLVEIFHDFLARWGPGFKTLEDHHQIQLLEICDRIAARENGSMTPTTLPAPMPWVRIAPGAATRFPNPELKRVSDDVLRCVEDEFRRLREGDIHAQSASRGEALSGPSAPPQPALE